MVTRKSTDDLANPAAAMSDRELQRALEFLARPLILELLKRDYDVVLNASLARAEADPEEAFFEFFSPVPAKG